MIHGIRPRLLAWLALVVLPAAAAGLLALSVVDQRLYERIEADLANALRLEAARVENELDDYRRDAESLASGAHVRDFVAGVVAWDAGERSSERPIGGYDGFAVVDPEAVLPLQPLGDALRDKSHAVGAEVAELRMVSVDGRTLARTSGFGWDDPYDPNLLERVLSTGESAFGNAFRTASGEDRLGLVVPVTSVGGDLVGALVLEMHLGPVVDLVVEHEGFGESSESHVAQPTPSGDAEFITLLRFKRDAAFDFVVPKERGLPINASLTTPGGAVVRARDYRGVDSILAIRTLRHTRWGLVVKIDAEEALAPTVEIRDILSIAFGVTIVFVLAGWALYLHPLALRLKRASRAAARVAAGDYAFQLADRSGDEIAEMADSIDRLAADLTRDIALRTEAERRLRHQATHDELTGLHNRKHVAGLIDALERCPSSPHTGLLFMDLDRFKAVNDEFGHAIGDVVLVEAARRIREAVGDRGSVARWGGDEFVVVLPRHDLDATRTIARRIENAFVEAFATEAGRHDVGCSIGLASSAEGGTLSLTLVRADARMYEVKAANQVERRARGGARDTDEGARIVESALSDERVEVWFQPLVRLGEDGLAEAVAVEALVRIRTVDGELLAPWRFLPAVHETPLGLRLDQVVLVQSLEALARWREAGEVSEAFSLFVNLDGPAVRDRALPSLLRTTFERLGLPPTALVLELSEGTIDLDGATLEDVRALGVGIAVDDLGIGCSNLDRLLDTRPDIAKIDRRWLGAESAGVETTRTRAVMASLLTLCEELGVGLVIEGIETGEESMVREPARRGHLLQGYHFHRPMPESDLRRCLANGDAERAPASHPKRWTGPPERRHQASEAVFARRDPRGRRCRRSHGSNMSARTIVMPPSVT